MYVCGLRYYNDLCSYKGPQYKNKSCIPRVIKFYALEEALEKKKTV